MGRLKRWTAGIVASFDSMIMQVENHEAVVNGALREIQEAAARARVQLGRVRKDGIRMRERLTELRGDEDRWRERATQVAAQDEKNALECVRRARRLAEQRGKLETEERAHAKLEKQLVADLERVEQELEKLKEKKNFLRLRQSRAEALATIGDDDTGALEDIESIFDRWEIKVSDYEYSGSCGLGALEDELEHSFRSAEEESELRAELAKLVGSAAPGNE